MATFKYFYDAPTGEALQLKSIRHDGSWGYKAESFSGLTPSGERVAATRVIEMKKAPSRHKCDDRCVHASGRIMRCECACGGANHGKGA